MDKLYWPAGRNKYTRTKLDQISVLLLKTRNKNEIRAGKRKSRDAVYVSLGSPEAQRQIITELFRQTVPDYGFCSHARVITFGRAALHLSNQRPERPFSISICERERGGGGWKKKKQENERERESIRIVQPSCYNFVSLTFAFRTCSIDIGNCIAAANTLPETR